MKLFRKKWLLIIAGSLTWSLTMIKSGIVYSFGMGFWGPNGHDGIWHIALIESLSKGSLVLPVFAGENIKNYHIGFDLLLAILHRISSIPTVFLYFQILPPLFALLIGYLVYEFVYKWTQSKNAGLWSTFFVYFSGSLGWVVTLFRGEGVGGESMFWAQQALSTLVNPPFALSLIVLLIGLILIIKNSNFHMLLAILLFGSLIQIKAYAAILVLGSLLIAGILKRDRKLLLLFGCSFVLSLILFIPFNKTSTSLFVFQPGWFLETVVGYPDRFGWMKLYSAMTTYRMSGNFIKGIPAYLLALGIFLVGNLGIRLFGIYHLVVSYKRRDFLDIFVWCMIIGGIITPMLFIQQGTVWNTIQFFYYSLFFLSILTGISFSRFIDGKPRLIRVTSVLLILGITISTVYSTLRHYLPHRPPAMVSKVELEALNFLKNQPDGIVLTYPFDKVKADKAIDNPPRPLYLYESTAYVSAFTGKKTFLEDEVNLNITGYDWKRRRLDLEEVIVSNDTAKHQSFLSDNNIRYIYLTVDQITNFPNLKLEKIYANNESTIYRVY